MLEHIGFESSEHVRSQHVMEFLYLVFFSNISEFFQEALQVAKGDGKHMRHLLDDKMSLFIHPHLHTYLNLSGVRKLSRWKSSSKLFWRGVPVSSSLC